jgi:hypothetical protein
MDIRRFTELVACYGAARERWPEEQRALCDPVAATPAGMAVLADAQRVDDLLDAWTPRVEDTGRAARILAAAHAPQNPARAARANTVAPPRSHTRTLTAWLSVGFAASAVLGFVLGFTQANTAIADATYAELLFGNTTVMEEIL